MIKPALAALVFSLPVLAFAQTSYTVRKGDTLLSIADRELRITDKKDPRRYKWARQISAKNPQLKNPNALEPGDVITLPEVPGRPPAKPVAQARAAVAPQAPPEMPPGHGHTPPPETDAAPAPAEPAHAEDKHDGGHSDFIGLQPRFQTLTLDATNEATNEKGKLTSSTSVGLDLQYGKILSDKTHLLLQAGYTSTNFKEIEGETSPTVDHTGETQTSFGVGFAYDLLDNLHVDVFALMADRTFIIPGTTHSFELKKFMLPGAELNLSWDFLRGSSYVMGASAIAEYFGATEKEDIKYKAAVEPVGAVYWTSKFGHDHVNYRVGLTFKQGHQHTSVSEHKESATVLAVMMVLPLGGH